MSTRNRNALILVVLLAAMVAGYVLMAAGRPVSDNRVSALDGVPAGALIVGSVDLSALRKSSVGKPLLSRTREIRGLGKVSDVCGFDPLDQLREIAFAVPAAGDEGEFGIAAVGEVSADALLACASKVIEARGGKALQTTIGSFRTVRDGTLEGVGGEIAVGGRGFVLVSGGAYLRAMIDAAEMKTPTVRTSVAHSALAEAVEHRDVLLTVVLTDEQRQLITNELGGGPTTDVVAMGLGALVGDRVGAHGVLFCGGELAAQTMAQKLGEMRAQRAEDYGTRLIGLGTLFDAIRIDARGAEVHAEVDATAEDAALLLDRVLTLRGTRHPMPGDDASDAPPMPGLPGPFPSSSASP